VDPRGGCRVDRPAVWRVAGAHHRRPVSAHVAVQPATAQAARPGANPAAVARWLEEYPAIVVAAKRDGGVVLWLDEMGVRADQAAGRSWAPVGQTPVVKRTGKRFGVNLISAISNQGLLRFRLFEGSFAGPVFIDFLRRLLRDLAGRKVHLIVDGHPVHRAKLVSGWWRGMPSGSSCTFCRATARS
jgi:DDE superfamily endonuclease